jgi:chromosome partitioning protein
MLASQADGVTRLRDALARNQIPFDFILIDTPPTLGVLTANGLVAGHELVVPIQCQYLAMRGVRSILDTLTRIQQTGMNSRLKLGGVFATFYRAESQHSREALEEIRSVFGSQMFSTIIDYNDIVPEAPVAGQSLLDYAPSHPSAQAYRALAEEILQR